MVRWGISRNAPNGIFRNFKKFGGGPQSLNALKRQLPNQSANRNRRNFDFERSRGRRGNDTTQISFGQEQNRNAFRINRRRFSNFGRNNFISKFGRIQNGNRPSNRFRRRNRFQNRSTPYTTQSSAQALASGGLDEVIMASRRGIGRRNGRAFNRGKYFRRDGWKPRRGGRNAGGGERTRNLDKESLDAQLDNYMGDDAVKNRLDMDLDSYFGRDANVEIKQDVEMTGFVDIGMDGGL